jgi:uncharacterized protein (DUF697 family)
MAWFEGIWDRVKGGVFDPFWKAVGQATSETDGGAQDAARRNAATIAPIIWLLGKTGSGKTSIVAALTRDPRAAIGKGFKPCTANSFIYDWPSEAPVLRFLDTRGLGEPGYDPGDDIAYAERQAHFLLVTMKIADPIQDEVLSALKEIRRRHPGWPVLVAQTALHALYPRGAVHPPEYPYSGAEADDASTALPHELRRALRYQRNLFRGLHGAAPIFVPLDFTLPEDGYAPATFGLEALRGALEKAGVEVLREVEEALAYEWNDEISRKAHPIILGYAAAAGASGAVPIPVVGIGGLVTFIGLMLRALADRYNLDWTWARISEFAGAIGTGALLGFGLKYGLRELLKLVPVAGMVAGAGLNAVGASALVYAIGRAACFYLGLVRSGQVVSQEEVHRVFKRALDDAFDRSRAAEARSTGPIGGATA